MSNTHNNNHNHDSNKNFKNVSIGLSLLYRLRFIVLQLQGMIVLYKADSIMQGMMGWYYTNYNKTNCSYQLRLVL